MLRHAPLAASALRLLAGRSRPTIPGVRALSAPRAPVRAKMNLVSTPAGIPVVCAPCGLSRSSALCRLRCRAPHGARSRRQSPWTRSRASGRTRAGISRWTLAPGGSARGAGWVTFLWRSRSRPRALAKARARARRWLSWSLWTATAGESWCRKKTPSERLRNCGEFQCQVRTFPVK